MKKLLAFITIASILFGAVSLSEAATRRRQVFVGDVEPSSCVTGDGWVDTSGTPEMKLCTDVSPITFAAVGSAGGAFELASGVIQSSGALDDDLSLGDLLSVEGFIYTNNDHNTLYLGTGTTVGGAGVGAVAMPYDGAADVQITDGMDNDNILTLGFIAGEAGAVDIDIWSDEGDDAADKSSLYNDGSFTYIRLNNNAINALYFGNTTGNATFVSPVTVPTEVYGDSEWNGDNTVPTKDAVRDKIETLGSGGATTDYGTYISPSDPTDDLSVSNHLTVGNSIKTLALSAPTIETVALASAYDGLDTMIYMSAEASMNMYCGGGEPLITLLSQSGTGIVYVNATDDETLFVANGLTLGHSGIGNYSQFSGDVGILDKSLSVSKDVTVNDTLFVTNDLSVGESLTVEDAIFVNSLEFIGDTVDYSGTTMELSDYATVGGNLFVEDEIYRQGVNIRGTGEIIAWAGDTNPSYALTCDGAAVNRTTYADLFSVIGVMYGNGDGSTTFNVPDLRGYFLRGMDGGRGIDPDRASRTDRGDTTTGDAVGTVQGDQYKSHRHGADTSSTDVGSNNWASGDPFGATYYTDYSGGNETRPDNIYVLYCIKI